MRGLFLAHEWLLLRMYQLRAGLVSWIGLIDWIDMLAMRILELVQLMRTGRWTYPRRKLPPPHPPSMEFTD